MFIAAIAFALILSLGTIVLASDHAEATLNFFDEWTVEQPAGVDSITFIVTTANISDGHFSISLEGLPEGASAPEYADVYENEFLLRLTSLSEAAVGTYSIILTIYNEDNSVMAITGSPLTLALYDPVDFGPEEPLYPEYIMQPIALRLAADSNVYTINGETRESDVAPFIDDDYNRTMVPLRIIAEALGAYVNWIDETRTVTIERGGVILFLQVDTPLTGDMGLPSIIDNRTFVPASYVAQLLGAYVIWDEYNNVVYIQE